MARFAKLDENNIVIDVIIIADKDCLDENGVECEEPGRCLCEALTGHANWKKTSYNTQRGVHYNPDTGEPSEDQSKAYRINYAESGMKYDEDLDAFVVAESYLPKEFDRMVINPQTGYWILPKPTTLRPTDEQLDLYPLVDYFKWRWNESTQEWIKMRRDEITEYPRCFRYEDML